MTDGVTNEAIFERLGSLTADMVHAKESRAIMHDKLDTAVSVQLKMEAKLDMTTAVAMQARDLAEGALQNIHRFEQEFREIQLPIITAAGTFKTEAEPIISTMRIIRNILLTLAGMGFVSLAGIFAAVIYAGEFVKAMIRWYLGVV